MQLLIISLGLLASAAYAKVLEIQVGNPTAATDPEKLSFSPDVQQVDPGDTVRFVFNGNHTVTQQPTFGACVKGAAVAGETPFDSEVKVKGETFDLPASVLVPGSTINYYCKIKEGAHCRDPNNMQGAIFVRSAGPASPDVEAPADAADSVESAEPAETAAPATDDSADGPAGAPADAVTPDELAEAPGGEFDALPIFGEAQEAQAPPGTVRSDASVASAGM
ncbi:MAG: hypothetical protein BJ554DRAFT_2183, partial [Olpidium bornovanus]